jgi:hypothetical protein
MVCVIIRSNSCVYAPEIDCDQTYYLYNIPHSQVILVKHECFGGISEILLLSLRG